MVHATQKYAEEARTGIETAMEHACFELRFGVNNAEEIIRCIGRPLDGGHADPAISEDSKSGQLFQC